MEIRMTTEQQQVAIAEFCGWKLDKDGHWITPQDTFITNRVCKICHGWMPDAPPDYLNDFNAIHEAEKMLPLEKLGLYAMWLCRVCGILQRVNTTNKFLELHNYIWHATALQKAEAFLRTIEKWKENNK